MSVQGLASNIEEEQTSNDYCKSKVEATHECNICSKSFKKALQLKMHKRIKHGERPELGSDSKKRLQELMDQEFKIAAQNIKEKYFNPFVSNVNTNHQQCKICNTNFPSKVWIYHHLKNSHSEIVLKGANQEDKTDDVHSNIPKITDSKNVEIKNLDNAEHSLIRGILTQSCSAGAKNFTKCVFYHAQFSDVIQNIAYHRAIFTLFVYVDYYQNNQFY